MVKNQSLYTKLADLTTLIPFLITIPSRAVDGIRLAVYGIRLKVDGMRLAVSQILWSHGPAVLSIESLGGERYTVDG